MLRRKRKEKPSVMGRTALGRVARLGAVGAIGLGVRAGMKRGGFGQKALPPIALPSSSMRKKTANSARVQRRRQAIGKPAQAVRNMSGRTSGERQAAANLVKKKVGQLRGQMGANYSDAPRLATFGVFSNS